MSKWNLNYDSNGDPVVTDCQKNNFALYYTSPESISAFQRLYENTDGLQDKFMAYWAQVADQYKFLEYVIGYDPINEPYPANYLEDPTIVLTPGRFDRKYLQPLYKNAYDVY